MMMNGGRASTSSKSRHINVRFFSYRSYCSGSSDARVPGHGGHGCGFIDKTFARRRFSSSSTAGPPQLTLLGPSVVEEQQSVIINDVVVIAKSCATYKTRL
jgi:hypothetical protein